MISMYFKEGRNLLIENCFRKNENTDVSLISDNRGIGVVEIFSRARCSSRTRGRNGHDGQ